ncbi:hypothetical protein [Asticcacaulis solisilvae]|uniref:hypothetical protein n=1 Tax=Asticcacaulis solisilvae TaxID=1217274 RepID=UPI003FD896B2
MPVPPLHHSPIRDDNALPERQRKGRGSVSNRTSARFGNADRYEVDDGWTHEEREGLERKKTILGIDSARRVISQNDSPDVGFDRSINPYKGCEHGCIYHPVTQVRLGERIGTKIGASVNYRYDEYCDRYAHSNKSSVSYSLAVPR